MMILTLIVMIFIAIRFFLIGSFRITGSNIGETVKAGDYVLVNKVKTNHPNDRNRLMLYQSPLLRDTSKPPLFIGRCIGLPGDVIQMGVDGFRVNGRLLPNAPMMQPSFHIHRDIEESLLQTLESLQIPLRRIKEDSTGIILRMSLREKELLTRNLSKVVAIELIDDYAMEYEFVIPEKGKIVEMTEIAFIICKEAILNETGKNVEQRDGKFFIDGKEQTSFTFKNDYFWVLSENETEGIDSRHLGIIPQSHIIGQIRYCWYSKDPTRRFKKIK